MVSVASIWELTIKESLGKLRIGGDLRQHLREQWFQELPVTGHHAIEVKKLPWHHKDPAAYHLYRIERRLQLL